MRVRRRRRSRSRWSVGNVQDTESTQYTAPPVAVVHAPSPNWWLRLFENTQWRIVGPELKHCKALARQAPCEVSASISVKQDRMLRGPSPESKRRMA